MKMRVVTVQTAPNFNAGQKAPSDIVSILKNRFNAKSTLISNFNSEEFFEKHNIVYRVLKRWEFTWTFIKCRIFNEVVVIQYPLEERTNFLHKLFLFNLRLLNKKKTIIFIHDLDGLRYQNDRWHKQDIERLNKVKYIVCHNKIMKDRLLKDGVKSKIFTLNLFDYLCDNNENNYDKRLNIKNPILVYAGNLKKEKSAYIYELNDKKMNFTLNLYGVGINDDIGNKRVYKNKYPANTLPNKLEGNLGLIWDGNSDSSDENIGMKNYTKINNPHKLSCYMAAGLPVIV